MALPALPSDAALLATLTDLQGQQARVQHRLEGFSLDPSPNPDYTERDDSAYHYGNGKSATRTLGPFMDELGRRVSVDIYTESACVPIQFASQSSPFMWVAKPHVIPSSLAPNVFYTLSPGSNSSVWISASLFTSAARFRGFVGLRISQGLLRISGFSIAVATTNPNPIIIPDTASLSLKLSLVAEAQQDGSHPSSSEFAVQTPQQVSLALTASSVTLFTDDQAKVTLFGSPLTLSHVTAPPSYDGAFNRILFAFRADKSSLVVGQSATQLVTWTGQADISAAFWSLPITAGPPHISPKPFSEASGAGGISLSLTQGLSVSLDDGSRPVRCGPCTLLAEGSAFAAAGTNAQGGQLRRVLQLPGQSQVAISISSTYAFRFINQFNGHEAWSVVPEQCSFNTDQLHTINDQSFSCTGLQGNFQLLRSSDSSTCLLGFATFSDTNRPPSWSFALKNLLIKTAFPALALHGQYDHGTITNAALRLVFQAQRLVPFLPDPYASNIDEISNRALSMLLSWTTGEQLAKLDIVVLPVRIPADSTLLDLSTKASQFGVNFTLGEPPAVQDLFLSAPANEVHLMALPAVQWEPVVTFPNPDAFPSPLSFPDSGRNVTISTHNSVVLVPIAPRQTIDTIVSLYNANPSSDVDADFTLPFGLHAHATLSKSPILLLPSPSLTKVTPTFSSPNLQSVDQISIHAPGRPLIIDGHFLPSPVSTSIPGTISLDHGPTDTTVLGVIQGTFDSEFGPNPRIPVTRVDLSGFGESVLSDWRDTTRLPPDISKVALDVLVGRTAKEVVQASSILYPYGVAVVREITIERQNSGVVLRHDSGWQASSDGHYQFPVPAGAPKLVIHPGLVKSVSKVRNIRDLGPNQSYRIVAPGGNIDLMPVKFDCMAQIENVVFGGSSDGVVALDQLGYVQITQLAGAGSLSADQYATLLQNRGPLGGLVDCVTDIGQSGLHMRILRLDHAATRSSTDVEFAVAASGAPILPIGSIGGGQWAFAVKAGADAALHGIDATKGVPLIQQNAGTFSPLTLQPYRFADPSDLLAQDDPHTDYALLHSTPAHRVAFLRPKLEASAPFRISSVLRPSLADAYALSTSTGPFPPTESCIPIPDPNWGLNISSTGELTLQLSAPTFTSTALRRILHANPNIRSISYTADEQNQLSVITLAINSAASTWACKITNLSFALENDTYGEVLRVVGTVDSSSTHPTQMSSSRLVFGAKLGVVTKLVSFLQNFGLMPPLDVFFGSFKASGVMDLQKALENGQLGPFSAFIKKFVLEFDFKVLMTSTETESTMEITMEITLKVPIEVGMVVFLGAVDLKMRPDGDIWAITVGGGYGYEVEFLPDPLEAYAYAAVAMHITTGSGIFGYGAGVIIKMNIDLVVIEASATSELRGDLLYIPCGPADNPQNSIWAVGQITIALEISIFLVLDIEFDYQHQWSNNTNGGSCPLVDVL